MSEIHIIVGSMLGGTEYVAEAIEQEISANNHQITMHFSPEYSQINKKNVVWIVATSTHGAGDLPDNIQAFANDLSLSTDDLSTVNYAVIGVGDSSYDTYCFAAKTLDKSLKSKGCKKIIDNLLLDMQQDIDPEEEAKTWIRSKLANL